ncbi:hypothetical protein QCA50_018054 [Cerrena zonata]|uniref:Uncharacterized protein n=1 Tax=Cerrena zonata TaxID=2478898 RepID=A0AAW0FHB2_9APHY
MSQRSATSQIQQKSFYVLMTEYVQTLTDYPDRFVVWFAQVRELLNLVETNHPHYRYDPDDVMEGRSVLRRFLERNWQEEWAEAAGDLQPQRTGPLFLPSRDGTPYTSRETPGLPFSPSTPSELSIWADLIPATRSIKREESVETSQSLFGSPPDPSVSALTQMRREDILHTPGSSALFPTPPPPSPLPAPVSSSAERAQGGMPHVPPSTLRLEPNMVPPSYRLLMRSTTEPPSTQPGTPTYPDAHPIIQFPPHLFPTPSQLGLAYDYNMSYEEHRRRQDRQGGRPPTIREEKNGADGK